MCGSLWEEKISIVSWGDCGIVRHVNGMHEPRDGEKMHQQESLYIGSITELEDLIFKFEIKNNSKGGITYHFSTGQRFDYELINNKGEVFHTHSSTAIFMQATGVEEVASGESLIYEFDLSPLKLQAGTYKIKAWPTTAEGKTNITEKDIKIK